MQEFIVEIVANKSTHLNDKDTCRLFAALQVADQQNNFYYTISIGPSL